MTTKTPTTKKSTSKKTSKKAPAKKKSPDVGAVSRARAKTAAKSPAASASKPKSARANVARPAPKDPKPSAVKASLIVLADAPAEGMTTRELVTAMAERKLWTSPGGKTPEATLYASIVREIARKGEASRFKKVARGRFVLNTTA